MDVPFNQTFYPVSLNELFSIWNRYPACIPYAGGTELLWRQGKTILDLPSYILCLDKIQDLHSITRTEHYLEIGSMVKLNRLIRLGKIVPEVLCRCLETIGGVQLRNIATIGGNICCTRRLLDTVAPLIALDAQYEFRNGQTSRWVGASRFHTERSAALEKQELLTRIRLPLSKWDYSMYKKFYSEDVYINKTMVFLAKTQKNILQDIKVIYKDRVILRNKSAEGLLIGKYLPLSRKSALEFLENWKEFLENTNEIDDLHKNEMLNSIEINIYNLSE